MPPRKPAPRVMLMPASNPLVGMLSEHGFTVGRRFRGASTGAELVPVQVPENLQYNWRTHWFTDPGFNDMQVVNAAPFTGANSTELRDGEILTRFGVSQVRSRVTPQ